MPPRKNERRYKRRRPNPLKPEDVQKITDIAKTTADKVVPPGPALDVLHGIFGIVGAAMGVWFTPPYIEEAAELPQPIETLVKQPDGSYGPRKK